MLGKFGLLYIEMNELGTGISVSTNQSNCLHFRLSQSDCAKLEIC